MRHPIRLFGCIVVLALLRLPFFAFAQEKK